MPSKTIDQLIINSPYSEPREHWKYDREIPPLFSRPGRRPAGYVRASESSKHSTTLASSSSFRWLTRSARA